MLPFRRLLFTKENTLYHEPGDGQFKKHRSKGVPPIPFNAPSKVGGAISTESSRGDVSELPKGCDYDSDVTGLIGQINDISLGSSTTVAVDMPSDVVMEAIADGQSCRVTSASYDDGCRGDDGRCSSVFVEPVEWMAPLLLGHKDGKARWIERRREREREREGLMYVFTCMSACFNPQITCPKCSSRIGSFDWAGNTL